MRIQFLLFLVSVLFLVECHTGIDYDFSNWSVLSNEKYVELRYDTIGNTKSFNFRVFYKRDNYESIDELQYDKLFKSGDFYETVLINNKQPDTVIMLSDKDHSDRDSLIWRDYFLVQRKQIEPKSINCPSIGILLDSINQVDQSHRDRQTADPLSDFQNLEIVISIIEKCDLLINEHSESSYRTIWLVLQHNSLKYQEEYFDFLAELVEQGKLQATSLAVMQDRILINKGLMQIYGSQLKSGNKGGAYYIPCLQNAIKVDSLRRSVGFEKSLQEYVADWGVEFDADTYNLAENCID